MDTNLTSILQVALQQGIWAALYIYLFFRMLKENAERETNYQSMIDTLSGTPIINPPRNCQRSFPSADHLSEEGHKEKHQHAADALLILL